MGSSRSMEHRRRSRRHGSNKQNNTHITTCTAMAADVPVAVVLGDAVVLDTAVTCNDWHGSD